MSILSNTINLNDYMSPALRHICTAINQTISSMEHMQRTMNTNINVESMRSAREEISRATIYLDNFEDRLRSTQQQFYNTGRSGESAFGKLGKQLKTYMTTYGMAMAGKWMLNTSDEMSIIKSKINMINDGLMTTTELNRLIFNTAQESRASYSDMAQTITRIRMNAGEAFSSVPQAVKFAEILNKQFKIAGATQEETAAATLQLTQALGSGVLRGDELNSVFEAAPSVIQSIADYMDIPIGKVRELASEGLITSDIIKNAMLDESNIQKVNEQYSKIPLTYQDLWVRAINNVKLGLMETSSTLNSMANSENMIAFVDNLANMTSSISTLLAVALTGIASVANFAYENWSILAPVLSTVLGLMALYKTETAITKALEEGSAISRLILATNTWMTSDATFARALAQQGFNASLYACPLTWYVAMIMLVVGAFFLLIGIINQVTGANISAVGFIVGAWYAAGALICNAFILMGNVVDLVVTSIMNTFISLCISIQNDFIGIANAAVDAYNWIGEAFNKAGNAIAEGIAWGCNKAIDMLNGLISMLNKIPGVNISPGKHIKATVGYHKNVNKMAYKTPKFVSTNPMKFNSISGAYKNGYNIGAGFKDRIFGKNNNTKIDKNLDKIMKEMENGNKKPLQGGNDGLGSNAGKHIKDTADNTAKIVDELKATGENIEYLRDLAEREVINRFTTAEIKINMTNNNNISNDMDIDGVVRKLTDGVVEAMNTTADGVHIA